MLLAKGTDLRAPAILLPREAAWFFSRPNCPRLTSKLYSFPFTEASRMPISVKTLEHWSGLTPAYPQRFSYQSTGTEMLRRPRAETSSPRAVVTRREQGRSYTDVSVK